MQSACRHLQEIKHSYYIIMKNESSTDIDTCDHFHEQKKKTKSIKDFKGTIHINVPIYRNNNKLMHKN